MSYFLGTENVNRISLKINLLFHRKDQRKCKAITDAQFSEQTWCGTKEERTLLPAINIPSCLRLGKQLYFFSRRLRYIPQGKMETCFGKRLKKNTTLLIEAISNMHGELAISESEPSDW